MLSRYPRISQHLPGIQGQIRQRLEDFVVEEVLAYPPSGQGEHLFICLTKKGRTTREIQEALARALGLQPRDVGVAGLKDKQAVTTQTFSVPRVSESEAWAKIQTFLPDVQVHWIKRHPHKLRVGHLKGNRFRIVVRGLKPGDVEKARAIAAYLLQYGVPNYFGEQRFGMEGNNVQQARAIFAGRGPRQPWLRKLLLSAWQGFLFNEYLAERIRRGGFFHLWPGDIAQKSDTRGLFVVRDPEKAQPRYQRGEIHFTGPMYGYKMWWAEAQAGQLEHAIWQHEGVTLEDLRKVRLKGTRRPGRLWLEAFHMEPVGEDALMLSFFLPKGGYATVVLREFLRNMP